MDFTRYSLFNVSEEKCELAMARLSKTGQEMVHRISVVVFELFCDILAQADRTEKVSLLNEEFDRLEFETGKDLSALRQRAKQTAEKMAKAYDWRAWSPDFELECISVLFENGKDKK